MLAAGLPNIESSVTLNSSYSSDDGITTKRQSETVGISISLDVGPDQPVKSGSFITSVHTAHFDYNATAALAPDGAVNVTVVGTIDGDQNTQSVVSRLVGADQLRLHRPVGCEERLGNDVGGDHHQRASEP